MWSLLNTIQGSNINSTKQTKKSPNKDQEFQEIPGKIFEKIINNNPISLDKNFLSEWQNRIKRDCTTTTTIAVVCAEDVQADTGRNHAL